jgi:hypothetical protein
MNWQKHGIASLAALITFITLTVLSDSWGVPALTAIVFSGAVVTAGYLHYRRRSARAVAPPVTPSRDDRVVPQEVKIAVTLRDRGICQLRYPGCLLDREICFDHKYPWAKGGSSKDPDNIQLACGPCNRAKSDKVLV